MYKAAFLRSSFDAFPDGVDVRRAGADFSCLPVFLRKNPTANAVGCLFIEINMFSRFRVRK